MPASTHLLPRLRVVILTAILTVTALGLDAAPIAPSVPSEPGDVASAPLPFGLGPESALALYCGSNPSFNGRLTASAGSTTAVSRITSANVYGYVSNVVSAWSCTLYRRYSAVAWNTTDTQGRFNWGTLINSTGVACNWVVGSTDYLKANDTADCPDSDAEYAMQVTLTAQRVYRADAGHDTEGDFSFAHADCDTSPYYGAEIGKGSEANPVSFSTGATANRPGANCDPITLDGTNTSQTITYDSTPPVLSFTAPSGAAYRTVAGDYTVTLNVTEAVAGFGGSNVWSVQRKAATLASNTCAGFANDGSPTTGTATGARNITQSLVAGHCYQWVASATDQNGNAATTPPSAMVKVDDQDPVANFTTPDEGSMTVVNGTQYVVEWSESDPHTGIASRSLQRRQATWSGSACVSWGSWGTGVGTTSAVTVTGLEDGKCYQWQQTLTDIAGNTATYPSGTIRIDVGTPSADFATPDEGTTAFIDVTSYDVAWSESVGSGSISARSLQRTKGQVVTPGTCSGVDFQPDGTPYAGTSPRTENPPLTSGYCYRWVQTLTNSVPKSAASTSGNVFVDTADPTATLTAPTANTALVGTIAIEGIADDALSFAEYEVEYGAGEDPGSWTSLGVVSTSVPTEGALAEWQPGGLSGVYSIRLTVRDRAGNSSTDTRLVYLENTGRGEEAYHTRVPFDLGGGWGLDVGVANGEARLVRDLFSIPSYGPPQALSLGYSSLETGAAGMFGVGWSSNLTQYLSFDVANAITTWHRADGGRVPFALIDSSWTPLAGHHETMSVAGGEVTITLKDQSRLVFEGTGAGRLKRIENRFGKDLTLDWGASSATATDHSGRETTLAIDSGNGRISGATDSAGRTWAFGYTGTGAGSDLTCITDPAGKVTRLGYTGHALTSVSRGAATCGTDGSVTWAIGYAAGKATTVTDPIDGAGSSNDNRFTYAAGETTVEILKEYGASPTWNASTYTLDDHGRVIELLDAEGYTTRWVFDEASNLTEVTRPIDAETPVTTMYEYDTRGNVEIETVPIDATRDAVTRTSYNATNDVLTRSEADNDASAKLVTKYTYDASGHLTSVIVNCTTSGTTPPADASTCTGEGAIDASTNLITSYAYTADDQLEFEQDPLGRVTRHVYDEWGNETSVIRNCTTSGTTPPSPWSSCTGGGTADHQTNVTTSTVYSQATTAGKAGLPTAAEDALGSETTFTHDLLGRQTGEALPGDASIPALTRTTAYDEFGNVLTETESWTPIGGGSAVNRTTTHEYDPVNREELVTDAAGAESTTDHDAAGNAVSVTSGGVTTTFEYDGLGRATGETTGDGTVSRTFDAAGNEVQTDSAEGEVTTRSFTWTGWLLDETVDLVGAVATTSHEYDRLGRETSVTDPSSTETSTVYDRPGRTVSTTTPAGTMTNVHDRNGNLVATKQLDGSVTATAYDPLDRATESIANCTDSGTTQPAAGATCAGTGTHDETTNLTTTSYLDAAGTVIAVRDSQGITARTIPNVQGAAQQAIANCADSGTTPTSNPRACTGQGTQNASTNVRTTYVYDGAGAGLRSTVAVGTGAEATTRTVYDAAGRVLAVMDPMGTVTRSLYSQAGQLTATIVNCTDDDANPQPPSSAGAWWACDGSAIEDGTWNVKTSYTYDPAGNRASETAPNGRVTSYTYDGSNRLITRIDNDVDGTPGANEDLVTTYFYDPAGRQVAVLAPTVNRTTFTITRSVYDEAGRLVRTIAGCTPAQPEDSPAVCGGTDGMTLGTQTFEANVVTDYEYDPDGNLVKLTAPDPSAAAVGTVVTRYAYDNNRLCRVLEASTITDNAWATAGCSGSIDGTSSTNVSTRYTYDAAGNLASAIDAAGHTTAYTYDEAGRLLTTTDAESGVLVYGYDNLGRRIRQENRSNSPMTPSVTWTYDGAGRILSRTFGTQPALDEVAPAVPTGVTATANAANEVAVSWAASRDNVATTSYLVSRDGNPLTVVHGTTTEFTDTSVAPSTAYPYTVVARDAAGNASSASSAANVTTPSNLTTVASDDFSGSGALAGSTADVGGTWGAYFGSGSGGNPVATLGSGIVTLGKSTPSGTRRYFSQLGSGTAGDADLYVTDLTGDKDDDGTSLGNQYKVGVFARRSGSNYYYTYTDGTTVYLRRVTSGSDVSITTGSVSAGNGGPVRIRMQVSGSSPTAIRVRAWGTGGSEPGTWAIDTTDSTAGNQMAAGGFGLTAEAYSATDTSYYGEADDVLVTTGSGGGGTDTTAPSTPTGLAATANGSARIDLAWTASTDDVGVQGYRIYRDGDYLLTVGSPSWSDLDLSAGTEYAYAVVAVDAADNGSAQSSPASATTGTASSTTTYTYDANGNRLTATEGTMTISATYDRLNRVTTVDDEDAGTGADTSYAYDLTSPAWTDPTGSYGVTLDAFDRPTALDDPVTATDFTFAYRADGQPDTTGQPNGNTTAFGYDALGRPATMVTTGSGGASRAAYAWTRNAAGQVRAEQTTITGDPGNGTRTFDYDALGRLVDWSDDGGTTETSYGWDKVLNRTSVDPPGAAAIATAYDAANRPTDQAGVADAYASDADGRLTARPDATGAPSQHMTWDTLGRLTEVSDATGHTPLARYAYDPLDRLRTVDHGAGDRIRFRYQGLTTSAVQVLDDDTGAVIRHLGTGWGGEPLADWTGGGSDLRIYGRNGHHDVTWTAGSTGTVAGTVRYDPWGTATSVTGTVPDLRFQGSWADDVTDLSWVVTRWYAPAEGRFLSEDSLLGEPRDPDSRHLYAYGGGDPVGAWDPDGMYWYRVGEDETPRSIATRALGLGTAWRMLANANRRTRMSADVFLGRGSCLWIPVEWLAAAWLRRKYDRAGDNCVGFRTSRALADADARQMRDAQWAVDLGPDHSYLFSFSQAQLIRKTQAKVRRSKTPSADEWKRIFARVDPFNRDARNYIGSGSAVQELSRVWFVYDSSAPWYCLGNTCAIGEYILANGRSSLSRQVKAHEYIHVLQWEGRGQEFKDSYILNLVMWGSGGLNREEATGYAWQYWTWMFPQDHLPWEIWKRPPWANPGGPRPQ